jgi:8-amino-3,8-dideoxy-alpha-D-manno-octulosonate transaminase
MVVAHDTLAIDGGVPVRSRPLPPMYPGGMVIGEEEKQAVLAVLDDKNLFRFYGPSPTATRVGQFERRFAEHMGARLGLAVSSGTAALHCALVALGIGPGDEVIVPAYTFIATASAVIAAKAVPIIAEVDDSLTLDPDDVERHITPRTRAILPVHMRGAACDMERLLAIARRHRLRVLEDVAQACGASLHGRRLGTFGEIGAYSLQYHKVITTGEGGVVLTDDQTLYDRARIFHDGASAYRGGKEPLTAPVFPGLNYRMGELCGALGLVQLDRLEGLLQTMRARKAQIRSMIAPTLEARGVRFRRLIDPDGEAAVAMILYMPAAQQARDVARALSAENIGAGSMFNEGVPDWHIAYHWEQIINQMMPTEQGCPFRCPLYTGNPAYSKGMAPRTHDLLARSVHLNISPLLTEADAEQIGRGLNKVIDALL